MRESDFIKNYYEIDFGLTLFFNQIYGEEEYYKFKEYATLSDYKKQFCKLLTTLEKSFLDTCIISDNNIKKDISYMISEQKLIIKNKKNVEDIYKSLIIFYPKLCFLLIGKIPENYSFKTKSNRQNWNLNEFRQIEYKLTIQQKKNLIINLLKNKKIEGLSDYNLEIEKYKSTRLEDENFIDWFIRIYPYKYIEIFS